MAHSSSKGPSYRICSDPYQFPRRIDASYTRCDNPLMSVSFLHWQCCQGILVRSSHEKKVFKKHYLHFHSQYINAQIVLRVQPGKFFAALSQKIENLHIVLLQQLSSLYSREINLKSRLQFSASKECKATLRRGIRVLSCVISQRHR